jgi:ribosomal-protein-alanine N-acetyltransferase
MTVRKAAPADAEALRAIQSAWPTTPRWTLEQLLEELAREDADVLVAEEGPGVRGYACLRAHPPEGELLNIAVRPDSLGRGLGRALLAALLGRASARGLERVLLEVEESNAHARRLYLEAGFRAVGRRRGFYGPGRDAVLMTLELDPGVPPGPKAAP